MDIICISNYKELLIEQKKLVKYEQIVVFEYNNVVYKYEVRRTFLWCDNYELNSKIFKDLFLDKCSFCTKHYGYKAEPGDFPVCRYDDYAALTRVVIALFQEIESRTKCTSKEVKKETKVDNFKLNVSLLDLDVTIRI